MKVIPPALIDDAALVYSSVAETPDAYDALTTYVIGSDVGVAVGNRIDVYTSQANTNLGHTPASSPTWWALTSVTYPPYDVDETYAEDDIVLVVGANSHHAFQSIQGGNTGHPVTDPAWWVDMGATNRWRMLDASNTTQTRRRDGITVFLQTAGLVDAVAVFNAEAAELRVTMTDPVEGVVYDQTFPMVSDGGVTDWFAYFNTPIDRIPDKVVQGLPYYAGAQVAVRLTNPGEEVACGTCAIGLTRTIAGTQWGGEIEIQDYSTKEADQFGDYSFVQRAFAKRLTCGLVIDTRAVDTVANLLNAYRTTPVVWVGDDARAATAVLGIYKTYSIAIAYPDVSFGNLQLEGLT